MSSSVLASTPPRAAIAEKEKLQAATVEYALTSCRALEEALRQRGKGWCPLCGLVDFEGYCVGYRQREWEPQTSRRILGSFQLVKVRKVSFTYYRAPHRCPSFHGVITRPFMLRYSNDLQESHGSHHSIVDAPQAQFEEYGFSQEDVRLIKSNSLDVFSF